MFTLVLVLFQHLVNLSSHSHPPQRYHFLWGLLWDCPAFPQHSAQALGCWKDPRQTWFRVGEFDTRSKKKALKRFFIFFGDMTRIKLAEDLLAGIREMLTAKCSLKLLNRKEDGDYLRGYDLSAQALPHFYADKLFSFRIELAYSLNPRTSVLTFMEEQKRHVMKRSSYMSDALQDFQPFEMKLAGASLHPKQLFYLFNPQFFSKSDVMAEMTEYKMQLTCSACGAEGVLKYSRCLVTR